MCKFYKELTEYAKASGAFEYAAKRYLGNKTNQQLRQEVDATFDYLVNVAFPAIEKLYKSNPGDDNAASVYEIACRDKMQCLNKYNSLP